jgi:hypothetical protein
MSVRSEWELMVDEGLLVPTGEMRPDSKGKLQPVYVLSERAKILHAVMLRELWDGVLPDVADL